MGLCAKSTVYELLNFTLLSVRASMLQTTRDLQLAAAVNSFQLDNQLLETLRPVVLSPHNMPGSRCVPSLGSSEGARSLGVCCQRASAQAPVRPGNRSPGLPCAAGEHAAWS